MSEKNPKLLEAIVNEVESYFSDDNLKNEPFLLRQIQRNPGEWMQLKNILNRNKFYSFRAVNNDLEIIAAAIENLPSGLVQVSEDHQQIRRNPEKPLPRLGKQNCWECKGMNIPPEQ